MSTLKSAFPLSLTCCIMTVCVPSVRAEGDSPFPKELKMGIQFRRVESDVALPKGVTVLVEEFDAPKNTAMVVLSSDHGFVNPSIELIYGDKVVYPYGRFCKIPFHSGQVLTIVEFNQNVVTDETFWLGKPLAEFKRLRVSRFGGILK